jgi:HK97 family phage portal protein
VFEWLRGRLTTVKAQSKRGISLIANYLAGVLWNIDNTWRGIIKQAYGGNAVAYAAVRLLSQSIPEARMRAYVGEDDDRKPLPNTHPLMKLIRRPNELLTEFGMWELATIHLAAVGRSCWFIERTNAGEPLALWPLRPDRVGPVYDPVTTLSGWAYVDPSTGAPKYIPARDVIVFLFPDPDGESGGLVEGFGPLCAGRTEIAADNAATNHTGALLANYAQPGVALKITDSVDEDTARIIKAKFRQEFGGKNAGGVGVLDAGTEITTLGFSLKDLDFSNLRADTESRICAAVGVPSIMVGVNSGLQSSTYSNFQEARLAFSEGTLSFYWRRYSDQMTIDLASEYGEDIVCEFDTSTVKALATQFAAQIAPWSVAYKDSVITRDEYRAHLHLEPLGGILGGSIWVPTNGTDIPADEDAIKLAEAEAKVAKDEQAATDAAAAAAQPVDAQGQPIGQEQPMPAGSADAGATTPADIQVEVKALLEAKAHMPLRVAMTCPLCHNIGVDRYADHGGLCVCAECGSTFDPAIEL